MQIPKSRHQLTIERLDSGQILLPTHVLPVNLAKIGYEEGILFTSFADILVNAFNLFLQSVSNQRLGCNYAMIICFDVRVFRSLKERIEASIAIRG